MVDWKGLYALATIVNCCARPMGPRSRNISRPNIQDPRTDNRFYRTSSSSSFFSGLPGGHLSSPLGMHLVFTWFSNGVHTVLTRFPSDCRCNLKPGSRKIKNARVRARVSLVTASAAATAEANFQQYRDTPPRFLSVSPTSSAAVA